MNNSRFAAVTREARAMSRRGSLRILGGAALVSVVPTSAVAKAAKKSRKRKRCPKPVDPCQGQAEQCRSHYEVICEGNTLCKERSLPCCESFASCNVLDAMACLFGPS
jgi:hypothetical protein